MLSGAKFICQSLELHLFFGRIMKEHSFFLEVGFTPKNEDFIRQADRLRREFDRFLEEVIPLANGVVRCEVLESGEVVTPFTLSAEEATSRYSGIKIPTELTKEEEELIGGCCQDDNILAQKVHELNQKAIVLISDLIKFKRKVLKNVLRCEIFTFNYPLLIEHILREAKLYLRMVKMIQRGEKLDLEKEAFEQEKFWNRIMSEHAKFVRGLLDPTEIKLMEEANCFAHEFDRLLAKVEEANDTVLYHSRLTEDSLRLTKGIRNFKAQATEGLLDCKIKSVILPLLGDHILREANHYLRLLRKFEENIGGR